MSKAGQLEILQYRFDVETDALSELIGSLNNQIEYLEEERAKKNPDIGIILKFEEWIPEIEEAIELQNISLLAIEAEILDLEEGGK